MSVSMNNLFNFSRALPEPFDKLTNKRVKVTSKYGSATEATLSCTMVKAVHAVCNCMVGTGEGAVGTIDHRTVAEYKSSAGPDMYHLVVFDSGSGNIMASMHELRYCALIKLRHCIAVGIPQIVYIFLRYNYIILRVFHQASPLFHHIKASLRNS